MRIVCLEQGFWPDPASYASNHRDWEARTFTESSISLNIRRAPADYPINEDGRPYPLLTTTAWAVARSITPLISALSPSDFRVRTLDGVADDWPIGYADLEPFYAENDGLWASLGLPATRLPVPRAAFAARFSGAVR